MSKTSRALRKYFRPMWKEYKSNGMAESHGIESLGQLIHWVLQGGRSCILPLNHPANYQAREAQKQWEKTNV